MNKRLLSILVLSAMTANISMAAPPVAVKMNEQSAALSQFAASHQRIKAKLTTQDREVLDQLGDRVRKGLPRNAQIPGDVIKAVTASTHGLSQEELEALGAYVSGEIIGGSSSSGNSENSLLQATQQMQEMQMSFNLQYLQLQNQMQNENRNYTMVSNIMKTKHDTVKNSISNIR